VWRPSSREMSSLEKVRPGMRPRFLSQKIEANEPEKKMPSTAAKAMRRSANVERVSVIHLRAHEAFFWMHGMVSMASKRYDRRAASLMYVSMRRE
jgi:hypothetical protein